MSYTRKDYDTKSALKAAVARRASLAGAPVPNDVAAELGRITRDLTIKPTSIVGDDPVNGRAVIEGPQYPRAHRFYAQVEVKDGVVVRFIG